MSLTVTSFSLYLSISVFISFTARSEPITDFSSPYLSPGTIFQNYQNMLQNFRIFIYKPNKPFAFNTPAESLFFSSLQNSSFVTQYPKEAHLFFVPFSPNLPTRSIARVVRELRMEFPYWNSTLGADHFYLSCRGLGFESDRNLVELKKNSIQISCFPTQSEKFVPHKDITLPPLAKSHALHAQANGAMKVLVNELIEDRDFLNESEPSDQLTFVDRLSNRKFCLFEYGGGGVEGIGEALRFGCVPVVITDRPIQDLPFEDVLRWQEIAVFVGPSVGAKELKQVLRESGLERVKGLGVTAAQHFVWSEPPQPFDAFHTVLYQLWRRRHTIRYARRQLA